MIGTIIFYIICGIITIFCRVVYMGYFTDLETLDNFEWKFTVLLGALWPYTLFFSIIELGLALTTKFPKKIAMVVFNKVRNLKAMKAAKERNK